MNPYHILLISAFSAFFITPLVIYLAKKFQILDFPSRPHPAILHNKPIPRAGGVATYLAIIITYLILSVFFATPVTKPVIAILVAGFILVAVGVLDDKYDVNPYLRILTNFLAAAFVVGSGIGITWFTNPFGGKIFLDSIIIRFDFPPILPFDFFAGPHSIILLADIIAFVWIIWVMNALNWSSGVDGQLSGIAVIGFLALGIASQRYLTQDFSQLAPTVLAFTAAGSYLGFLPWSFYPQKIMPGYGGATLAGLLIASLSIMAGAKLATSALLLIVPLVDGAWAVIRRLAKGRSPVWGDREHFHHQLLNLGWKKWQIALLYYGLGAASAFLALSLDHKGRFFAISVGGSLLLAFLISLAYFLNKMRVKQNA